jgi:hypothetical protein
MEEAKLIISLPCNFSSISNIHSFINFQISWIKGVIDEHVPLGKTETGLVVGKQMELAFPSCLIAVRGAALSVGQSSIQWPFWPQAKQVLLSESDHICKSQKNRKNIVE